MVFQETVIGKNGGTNINSDMYIIAEGLEVQMNI